MNYRGEIARRSAQNRRRKIEGVELDVRRIQGDDDFPPAELGLSHTATHLALERVRLLPAVAVGGRSLMTCGMYGQPFVTRTSQLNRAHAVGPDVQADRRLSRGATRK
jgi:hypothetical protein